MLASPKRVRPCLRPSSPARTFKSSVSCCITAAPKNQKTYEQTTSRQSFVPLFRGGQQAHLQGCTPARGGLRGELRRRVCVAHHPQPGGDRQALFRGDAPLARPPLGARQEGSPHGGVGRQGGPRHDSLRGCRLRLPHAGRDGDLAPHQQQPLRVPHLRLRHREPAVLQSLAP